MSNSGPRCNDPRRRVVDSITHRATKRAMATIVVFALGVQINRWVPTPDVLHIIRDRASPSHHARFLPDDMLALASVPQCEPLPNVAILVLESSRLHIFLHDSHAVCRCVWDDEAAVPFVQKKRIARNMIEWLRGSPEHRHSTHRITDIEDCRLFTEVYAELNAE